MGIEKFFNTIKKSYGNKIITKIEPNTYFPNNHLFLDFNSIIHIISQSVTNSIIYLYHIYNISNVKPDIITIVNSNIKYHINNISSDIILKGIINLSDLSQSDNTDYEKSINFNKLTIDDINNEFFDLLMKNDNIDKLVINKVANYVIYLCSLLPTLQYLYMAIDGVPLYAKMIEQKKRRTIGHIVDEAKKAILESYKKELDVDPNINDLSNEIYYNHYQFEIKSRKLKFNKNKISPGTQFMSMLQDYIVKYLNLKLKIKIELDPFENFGEGEKKIVFKINQLDCDSIMVFSPDADVILLMLNELNNRNIDILRYDQQLLQLDIININELHKIIMEYMKYQNLEKDKQHNIIKDVIMLFTILGNDFLPKIEQINTNRNIKNIFDAYISLNIKNSYLFHPNINYQLLKQFFINLRNILPKYNNTFRHYNKDWKLLPDQIVNSNAIHYYTHIFNLDNLSNIYEPTSINKLINNKINKLTKKYIVGMIWLKKYYLDHDDSYRFFYYKYDIAPTINQLIEVLDKLKTDKKLINNLERCKYNKYFSPIEQLIFITPINISYIVDKKLVNEKIQKKIDDYDLENNQEISFDVKNYKINLFDYLDCNNVPYLNKCEIKKMKISSGIKILHNILK